MPAKEGPTMYFRLLGDRRRGDVAFTVLVSVMIVEREPGNDDVEKERIIV
jgi:hypothetical protein